MTTKTYPLRAGKYAEDDRGNLFKVQRINYATGAEPEVIVESVATKECFIVTPADLTRVVMEGDRS